ncbi:NACHT domain-containing protein [Pycnococcus provasolii]
MAFDSEMLAAALQTPVIDEEERISSFGLSPSQVRTTRRSSVQEAMRLPNTKLLLRRASREHVHLSDVAAAAVAAAKAAKEEREKELTIEERKQALLDEARARRDEIVNLVRTGKPFKPTRRRSSVASVRDVEDAQVQEEKVDSATEDYSVDSSSDSSSSDDLRRLPRLHQIDGEEAAAATASDEAEIPLPSGSKSNGAKLTCVETEAGVAKRLQHLTPRRAVHTTRLRALGLDLSELTSRLTDARADKDNAKLMAGLTPRKTRQNNHEDGGDDTPQSARVPSPPRSALKKNNGSFTARTARVKANANRRTKKLPPLPLVGSNAAASFRLGQNDGPYSFDESYWVRGFDNDSDVNQVLSACAISELAQPRNAPLQMSMQLNEARRMTSEVTLLQRRLQGEAAKIGDHHANSPTPGAAHALRLSLCGARQANAAAIAIRSSTEALTSVLLPECNLGDSGCSLVCSALQETPHVTDLDLRRNRLSPRAMDSICALLFKFSNPREHGNVGIQSLVLSDNPLRDTGMRRLSHALSNNRRLTALSISSCGIADAGALALGDLLRVTTTIVSLDVSWNALNRTDKGAVSIADGIAANISLRKLNLCHCSLYDTGGSKVAYALRDNMELMHVDLSSNTLERDTCMVLAESLGVAEIGPSPAKFSAAIKNGELKCILPSSKDDETPRAPPFYLSLADNPLGYEGTLQLLRALARSRRAKFPNDAPDGFAGTEIPLPVVNLTACAFLSAFEEEASLFDESSPAGRYKLKLSDPSHRFAAIELCRLRLQQGRGCWQNCKLDGAPWDPVSPTLEAAIEAAALEDSGEPGQSPRRVPGCQPEALIPSEGFLELDFVVVARPPRDAKALTEGMFVSLWEVSASKSVVKVSDSWRVSLARLLANAAYFTADQVRRILASFNWPGMMRLEAAMTLFGRVIDPHRIDIMQEPMSPQERDTFNQRLGILAMFSPLNPTGRYALNLGRQVDVAIAKRCLHIFTNEQIVRESELAVSAEVLGTRANASKGGIASLLQAALGASDLANHPKNSFYFYASAEVECFRNAFIDGKPLSIRDPDWDVPLHGSLRFDFVSCKGNNRLERPMAAMAFAKLIDQVSGKTPLNTPELMEIARATKVFKLFSSWGTAPAGGETDSVHLPSIMPNFQAAETMNEEKEDIGAEQMLRVRRRRRSIVAPMLDLAQLNLPHSSADEDANKVDSAKSEQYDAAGDDECFGEEDDTGAFQVEKTENASEDGDELGSPQARVGLGAKTLERRGFLPLTAAKLKLLRDLSLYEWLSCEQLASVVEHLPRPLVKGNLDASGAVQKVLSITPRVESLVLFFGRCTNPRRFARVVRKISPGEQIGLMRRLGYLNVVTMLDPDMHYLLRLGRSDERDMCKRLVRLAARFYTVGEPCFRNLQLNGRPVNFVEDGKLWALLTSNSAESQNVVEFDFVANAEMRRNASVAFVQSYWRKVLRSERWDMRRQRGEAARTIQRWWRSVDLTSIRYNRSGEEIVRNL